MSVLISHKTIKEKIKALNLPLLIKLKLKEQEKKMSTVALNIGRSKNYLYASIKKEDQPISLLLLLSMHLQTNFIEQYINLLPAHLQTTQKEKALQQQIQTLQQQITDLQKERDLLKEIVMK